MTWRPTTGPNDMRVIAALVAITERAFGTAGVPGAGSPFYGYKLLIADRGNNRLLLIDDKGQIIWRYSSNRSPAPSGGFYFPDDAFSIRHGTAVISNRPGAIVEFNRAGGLDSNPSGDWLSFLTPWPLGLVRRTEHCRPGQLGAPVSRRVQPPVREVSPATF